MKKYFLKIYGCQYNEWDGAKIDYLLQKVGLTPSPEKDADVIFLLSCSVRKSAVDRVMGLVKNNMHKKVIVTGCILDNDKKKYEKKNVSLWDINKPADLRDILSCHSEHSEESSVAIQDDNFEKLLSEGSVNSSYVPIMIGCNNFCSYCAVPYTRGRELSRDFEEIVSDFKKLVEKGNKEIMLLGQNVNSYKYNFVKLLKTLNDIPGDFVIRFTSNHPKDMTDEIIAAVKELPKVKKEIHLPLQSGSNKILKAMNRPYTIKNYLKLLEKIKEKIPNIKISTDIIVGFPRETEEDFKETENVLKKVGFEAAYVNKYSPRFGTAAFKLGDPIPWEEKQRRWRILNDIANKK